MLMPEAEKFFGWAEREVNKTGLLFVHIPFDLWPPHGIQVTAKNYKQAREEILRQSNKAQETFEKVFWKLNSMIRRNRELNTERESASLLPIITSEGTL